MRLKRRDAKSSLSVAQIKTYEPEARSLVYFIGDEIQEQIDTIDRLYVWYEIENGENLNGLNKGLFSDFQIQFLKRFGREKKLIFWGAS